MRSIPSPSGSDGAIGEGVDRHGNGLSGGRVPGTPPNDPSFPSAANLTQAGPLGKWSQPDFVKALCTGIRPDESSIHPFMPWKLAGQMKDEEITATWRYLQSVPPKATGGR
ncbi:MAG: hypothetical protein H7338_02120 [Candidatus Sericytochromatia bacterium]|nr:hypothetical protein [Candidatus Sericytochromatia bacterium]